MASSSTPVHPARYLVLFLVLLIGAYLLVFLTGDKQPDPKLGIDLQGGTRVTLTARTPRATSPGIAARVMPGTSRTESVRRGAWPK